MKPVNRVDTNVPNIMMRVPTAPWVEVSFCKLRALVSRATPDVRMMLQPIPDTTSHQFKLSKLTSLFKFIAFLPLQACEFFPDSSTDDARTVKRLWNLQYRRSEAESTAVSLFALSPNRPPHASAANQQNNGLDPVPRRGIRGSGSRVNLLSASTSRRASGLPTSRLIWTFSISGAMCPALLWPFQKVHKGGSQPPCRGTQTDPLIVLVSSQRSNGVIGRVLGMAANTGTIGTKVPHQLPLDDLQGVQ